jgi:hypothetical protein
MVIKTANSTGEVIEGTTRIDTLLGGIGNDTLRGLGGMIFSMVEMATIPLKEEMVMIFSRVMMGMIP